jgi:hypothetical protein
MLLLIIAFLCIFSSSVSLLLRIASCGVLMSHITPGIFYTSEHAFCFSERPSVKARYEIEIKTYGKDEKYLLAESVEQMYEREYNVSTEYI